MDNYQKLFQVFLGISEKKNYICSTLQLYFHSSKGSSICNDVTTDKLKKDFRKLFKKENAISLFPSVCKKYSFFSFLSMQMIMSNYKRFFPKGIIVFFTLLFEK